MKKQKKLIVQILIFLTIVLSGYNVFATDIINHFGELKYSEEFKKYSELSDEEKEKVIMPKMYEVQKSKRVVTNPLKLAKLLGATLETKYSLKDVIPANVVVRNQKDTNSCWTFSSIGMLESTLALRDYKNGKSPVAYDFSERHMEYATSKTFKDGTNKNGFNREVGDGGNTNISIPYLTNGTGAILENDMPFENNEDTIELSKIENKKVITQVNDTVMFPSYKSTDDKTQIIQLMKEHIKNYGGIDAGIHGASIRDTSCYNNATAALYCDDDETYKIDHDILIVGWDDNYSKDNFLANKKPQNNGAWIIKNSWGTEMKFTLVEMKKYIFENYNEDCIENGYTTAELIPDETARKMFEASGFSISNDVATLKIGDNGFMYVSYEDVNIYQQLAGISDAQSETTYENIYQHSKYGGITTIPIEKESKVYVGTVFNKKTSGTEYLTQVSIETTETYTCKVYVNPKSNSMATSDLKQVQLKSGETEKIDAGYHTIEFLNPVQITGEKYAVVIEIQGTNSNSVTVMMEFNPGEFFGTTLNASNALHIWDNVIVESGKSFIGIENDIKNNQWLDTATVKSETNNKYPNFYTTVKAFTTSKITKNEPTSIEITNPPTKTSYYAGEDFDKTGMVVKAKYADGTSKEITDYTIKDGTKLTEGKTNVTIEYEGKIATQAITVISKSTIVTVTSIRVKTMPTKIQYIQNKEELDLAGGIIEVTYSDGTKVDASMTSNEVTVSGFNNKTIGKNTITITYKEKTTQFDIEIKVESNSGEENKKPKNSDFATMQGNVTNIKAYYFTDTSKKEYSVITVDISNITLETGNDSMEYYYYLSSNPKETNIENWIKVEDLDKTDNKLTFEINTSDISNYEDISDENNIYIYIKEIATLNNQKQEKITSALELEVDNVTVEEYIDGKKNADVDSDDIVNPTPGSNINTGNSENIDGTLATDTIPKAGKGMLMIGIIIITLAVIGRIMYLKYKDIQIK